MHKIANLYNENFNFLIGKDSKWLENIRLNLIKQIEIDGLPNKKKEIWKYANLEHINNINFKVTNFIKNHEILDESNIIQLIDGKYILPKKIFNQESIHIENLKQSINNFENYFMFNKDYFLNDFTIDINTIFLNEGLSIIIKNDKEYHLHIKYKYLNNDVTSFIRNIIKVNKNSKLFLIEEFENSESINNFSNIFNIFWLEEGAKVEHIIIQNSQITSNILYSSLVSCFENSNFNQLAFHKGSQSSKFQHTTNLIGRNSSANHNGIYFGKNKQYLDNKTTVLHHEENCKSNQSYKGILNDEANGSYLSKTVVNKKAQKTDGYQMSKCILLNDSCKLRTKPELVIYADDVKCSHGSTIGEIDQNQLFYLRSRGIDKKFAEGLLIKAFYQDVLKIINDNLYKDKINSLVDIWLDENYNEK